MKRVAVILLLLLAAWIGWEWVTFPDVGRLAKKPPETTAFMERRKRDLRSKGQPDELYWTWVSYGRIAPSLRRAVLVAEDNSFYEHEGVDLEAMREAARRDWKRRKITHGGSTITQQLAKNLYLSPSRNPIRKVREYFIARALEKELTKKRILEIYLNVVEFGERVYGAEAAARHYFRKPASALTVPEAALLAGALPNPRLMNPGSPNKRLRARQRMILSRMRRWGTVIEREVLTERKPKEPATATIPLETTETDGGKAAREETATGTPPPSGSEPTATDATTATPDEKTDTAPPAETAPPPATTTTGGPSHHP